MRRRSLLTAIGLTLTGGMTQADGADRASFGPLGTVGVPGTREAVVDDAGETAFLATTDGFATVDVDEPATPRVLADRRDLLADHDRGPLRNVHDLAVDGDRLAVAAPAHGLGLGGVVLYDVSDPAAPERVAFHEVIHPVHNCDLADGLVALTANDPREHAVAFVDVTGDEPEERARWALRDHDPAWADVRQDLLIIHDVTLSGGVAYCCFWDAGTWLLDVSDPATPSLLGSVGGRGHAELRALPPERADLQSVEPPGNAHYAEPSDGGDLLAVGGESWDATAGDDHGGPSGITLWDVSDPESPERLSTVEPTVPADATYRGTWTTAHNFELVGDRLYSSWYQDGVKIHDVSDPAAPTLRAHWRVPDATRFWTARLGVPGEFFVAASMGTDDGEDAALYCFPDRPGRQADQPTIRTATGETEAKPKTPSPSPTETRSPTEAPTTEPTGTPVGPRTATGRSTPPDATTAPGFGVAAALAALGTAGMRWLREED